MREKGRVFGLTKESIYIKKKGKKKSNLKILKMMTWKIVERFKASVLYIYIYIYIDKIE